MQSLRPFDLRLPSGQYLAPIAAAADFGETSGKVQIEDFGGLPDGGSVDKAVGGSVLGCAGGSVKDPVEAFADAFADWRADVFAGSAIAPRIAIASDDDVAVWSEGAAAVAAVVSVVEATFADVAA